MELADRIVFLADGKLVVDAPPSVIAASDNPRIRDFFSLR
jgi:ABC-type transporter Mla maintaining outer membrane lipid asymmetry ATPase subunit MlaF